MCAAPAVARTTHHARADGIYVSEAGDSRKDSRRRWHRVLYIRGAPDRLATISSSSRSSSSTSSSRTPPPTFSPSLRVSLVRPHQLYLLPVPLPRISAAARSTSTGSVSTARAARVVVGPGPWRHGSDNQSDRIGRVTCLGNAPLALARWARPLELELEEARCALR